MRMPGPLNCRVLPASAVGQIRLAWLRHVARNRDVALLEREIVWEDLHIDPWFAPGAAMAASDIGVH